jgi:hypothetical protein
MKLGPVLCRCIQCVGGIFRRHCSERNNRWVIDRIRKGALKKVNSSGKLTCCEREKVNDKLRNAQQTLRVTLKAGTRCNQTPYWHLVCLETWTSGFQGRNPHQTVNLAGTDEKSNKNTGIQTGRLATVRCSNPLWATFSVKIPLIFISQNCMSVNTFRCPFKCTWICLCTPEMCIFRYA